MKFTSINVRMMLPDKEISTDSGSYCNQVDAEVHTFKNAQHKSRDGSRRWWSCGIDYMSTAKWH